MNHLPWIAWFADKAGQREVLWRRKDIHLQALLLSGSLGPVEPGGNSGGSPGRLQLRQPLIVGNDDNGDNGARSERAATGEESALLTSEF